LLLLRVAAPPSGKSNNWFEIENWKINERRKKNKKFDCKRLTILLGI